MLEEDLAQRIIKLVKEKEDCFQEVLALIEDYTDDLWRNIQEEG